MTFSSVICSISTERLNIYGAAYSISDLMATDVDTLAVPKNWTTRAIGEIVAITPLRTPSQGIIGDISNIKMRRGDFDRLQPVFHDSRDGILAFERSRLEDLKFSFLRVEDHTNEELGNGEVSVICKPNVPGSRIASISALYSLTYSLTSNIQKTPISDPLWEDRKIGEIVKISSSHDPDLQKPVEEAQIKMGRRDFERLQHVFSESKRRLLEIEGQKLVDIRFSFNTVENNGSGEIGNGIVRVVSDPDVPNGQITGVSALYSVAYSITSNMS